MAKQKQCQRCGHKNTGLKACEQCGTPLIKKRFRMTSDRIRYVHAIATKKGLIVGYDKDDYKFLLSQLGVESCLDMKRDTFEKYKRHVERLPDAN